MEKWIYALLSGFVVMVLCSFTIALIFKHPGSIAYFIGAAISYWTGNYVLGYFKDKEKTRPSG